MAENNNNAPAMDAPKDAPKQDSPAPGQDAPKQGETVTIPAQELADIRKALSEANKEAATRRKRIEEIETAQQEAERRRLEEQGEFKTLADQNAAERDTARTELQSATDKLTKLNEILSGDIEKRIEQWPDEAKKLIPAEGDALERLTRVSELEPLAAKLMAAPAIPGAPKTPVPGGAPNPAEQQRPASYRI